jgi:hypothetical protein
MRSTFPLFARMLTPAPSTFRSRIHTDAGQDSRHRLCPGMFIQVELMVKVASDSS